MTTPRNIPPPSPVPLTDLGIAACALALGASIQRIDDSGQRITFILTGVPDGFFDAIEDDDLHVPARAVIRWLNDLAGIVRAKQLARRGLQGRQR